MVGPVCVLQVPDGSLLSRQEVFDLQARCGVAPRVRAEARGDLKSPVCNSVVTRAQTRPIAETLLSTPFLQDGTQNNDLDIRSKSDTVHNNHVMCMQRSFHLHLLRCNHCDDGDSLFPNHLPEVLAGAGERPLRRDVTPLFTSDRNLMKSQHEG